MKEILGKVAVELERLNGNLGRIADAMESQERMAESGSAQRADELKQAMGLVSGLTGMLRKQDGGKNGQ